MKYFQYIFFSQRNIYVVKTEISKFVAQCSFAEQIGSGVLMFGLALQLFLFIRLQNWYVFLINTLFKRKFIRCEDAFPEGQKRKKLEHGPIETRGFVALGNSFAYSLMFIIRRGISIQ